MKLRYEKYEFCKAVNCEWLDTPFEGKTSWGMCCTAGHGTCFKTAKDFRKWLKNNGFEIIKKEVKE